MRVAVTEQGFTSAVDELVVGNQHAAHVVLSLAERLSGSGGMAGDDDTATEFAASYDEAATASLDALESLVGAFGSLARLTEASLTNHARADADATLPAWARAFVGPRTAADGAVGVLVAPPPSSLGADTSGPGGMAGMVLDQLADVFWPNADTDRLRSVGAAWRAAGGSVDELAADCRRAGSHLAHERSPEVPLALASLDQLRSHLADLGAQLTGLGDACSDYADHVDAKRAELRDLLESVAWELGITAGLGLVGSFLSGGAAAGLAGGAAGARLASAGAKARGILESLRLLVSAPVLRMRPVAVTAGEVGAYSKRVARARVMLMEAGGRGARGGGPQGRGVVPTILARSEGVGRGHSLERHSGKSVDFLRDRASSHPTAKHASSFSDSEAAERWVNRLLARRSDEIDAWLSGTKREERFDAVFEQEVTGVSVSRSGDVLDVSGIRAILVRDPSMPEGFYVRTAFPKP